MRKIFIYLGVGVIVALLSGCIENDIPYPVIKLDILGVEVEGLKSQPIINATDHTVKLELEETTDMRHVNINSISVTEGAQADVIFPGEFDMRKPLYVNLFKYQTFEWTITASQEIERYFRVEGQIGDTFIDPVGCVATAYVPMDFDLKNVKVLDAKFGPKDISTYSPDPLSLTTFANTVRQVNVNYHGNINEVWTLRIIPKDVEVEFVSVDAWAQRIWLYANGRSGEALGFRYRLAGAEEWIEVEDVNSDGGSFSACVTGLNTLTEYEVIAYSGSNETPVVKVTTEDTYQLINSGFEDWSFANKSYFPYAEGASPFWGTGNPGSTTLGEDFNLTTPNKSDVRPGSLGTTSAKLQSMFPNMAGIGKFAAGNLFLGRFAGIFGTNGIVFFGRPSTARPVALHGWFKYTCGTIDRVGKTPTARPDIALGSMDEGQIMIAVGDWTAEEYGGDADSPVAIDTRNEASFFNIKGKNVIGAGEMLLTESTDGWVEFTLPLEYTTTSRVPTHIVVVFTGSHFGDYFTGSTQSCLMVDDVELLY